MEVVTRMWNDGRLAILPELGALIPWVWTPQLTRNSVALFWSFSVFSSYFETLSQNMCYIMSQQWTAEWLIIEDHKYIPSSIENKFNPNFLIVHTSFDFYCRTPPGKHSALIVHLSLWAMSTFVYKFVNSQLFTHTGESDCWAGFISDFENHQDTACAHTCTHFQKNSKGRACLHAQS